MTVPRNEQSFITRRIDKDIKQKFDQRCPWYGFNVASPKPFKRN